MRFLCSVLIAAGVLFSGANGPRATTAAHQMSGCTGSWLIRISIAGRDTSEDGLVTFEADGGLELVGPPVVPPLPNRDGVLLYVSNGVGHWQQTSNASCTFTVVRLLSDTGGIDGGSLYWRGSAELDPAGTRLSGSFSYVQSTPLGQTVASGSGTLLGTSLQPAVAAPPAAPVANLTTYENQEFGFRLTYDSARWQVQSQSASTLRLTDGNSTVAIGGSQALPTDATDCVNESIATLSVTSARRDYQPLLNASGNPVRRGGPLAAYAISAFRDRSGDERFERVECRTLPAKRGVVTILQSGALANVQSETANLEALLSRLETE